jgi:hypothetical protein
VEVNRLIFQPSDCRKASTDVPPHLGMWMKVISSLKMGIVLAIQVFL